MKADRFTLFQNSWNDQIFQIADNWETETEHMVFRHMNMSLEEVQQQASLNKEKIHSAFTSEWDLDKIQDEIFLEVLERESFVRNLFYDGRMEGAEEILMPARSCGIAVAETEEVVEDEDGNISIKKTYTNPMRCDSALVILYFKKTRIDGYDAIEELHLQTIYPANSEIIKRVKGRL